MYTRLFETGIQRKSLREASFGTQVKDKLFKIFGSLLSKRTGKTVYTSGMLMDVFQRDGKLFGGVMYDLGDSGERVRINVDMDDSSTRPYSVDYWPDDSRTDYQPFVSMLIPADSNLVDMMADITSLVKSKGRAFMIEAVTPNTIASVESWVNQNGYDIPYILKTNILDLFNDYNSQSPTPLDMNDFGISLNKYLGKMGVPHTKAKRFRGLIAKANAGPVQNAGTPGNPVVVKPGPAKPVLSAREKEVQQNLDEFLVADSDLKGSIDVLETLVRDVGSGSLFGLLVTGTPGIGKSYTTLKILKDEFGMSPNIDFMYLKGGKMTATGLYMQLHDNRDKLIIIDDNDSIWSDSDAINMLKGALEVEGPRTVSNSTKPIKGYDNVFDFGGQIIFITNLRGPDLSKAEPVLDRLSSVNFDISQESLIAYVEEMLDKIYQHVDMEIKIKVFEWFKLMGPSYKSTATKGLSIRGYTKTLDIVLRGHSEKSWKRLSLKTL